MLFSIYHHWWDRGISEDKIIYLNDSLNKCFQCSAFVLQNHFIEFADKKIFHLNNYSLLNSSTKKMKFDFIILSNNLKVSLNDLVKKFEAKEIIIDSSNSFYKASKWLKEAEQLHIQCYSVLHRGAFVFEIKS